MLRFICIFIAFSSACFGWGVGFSGPSSVVHGASYDVEASTSYGVNLTLYKNGYYAGSGYNYVSTTSQDFGTTTINYSASGYSYYMGTVSGSHSVSVAPGGSAPSVSIDAPSSLQGGETYSATIHVSDSDLDLMSMGIRWQGYGLVGGPWNISGGSASATITLTAPTSGSVRLRGDVWDNNNHGVAGDWIEIPVTGVNHAPSASITGGPSSLSQGESGTWSFSLNDDDSNLWRWRVGPSDQMSSWVYSGGSSYSNSFSGSFSSSGWHTVRVEVEDAASESSSAEYSVYVEPPNTAPFGWLDTATGSLAPNQTLSAQGWAADTESGAPVGSVAIRIDGNTVGYASRGGYRPDVANAYGRSDYAYSGYSFSYNIGNLGVGQHTVSAVAYDDNGASAELSGTKTFTVAKLTQSALTISPVSQTITVGQSLTFTAAGGSVGSYVWGADATGSPSSATSNPITFNTAGTRKVTVYRQGDNNYNASNIAEATITVQSVPLPSITSGTTASGSFGTSLSYTITASNSPTSFSATGLPSGLALNTNTGAITGTPTQAGNFNVALTASNSGGTGPVTNLALNIAKVTPARTFPNRVFTNPTNWVTITSAMLNASFAHPSNPSVPAPTNAPTYQITSNGSGNPVGVQIYYHSAPLTITATYPGDGNYNATTVASVFSVVDTQPPTAPTQLVRGLVDRNSFVLTWTPATDNKASFIGGYEVSLNNGQRVVVPTESDVYAERTTVGSLASGTTYTVAMRAVDWDGNWSAWSTPITVTTSSAVTSGADQSLWKDLDGDGIRDEIIRPGTGRFTYVIDEWATNITQYWTYPVNSHFVRWNFNFFQSNSDSNPTPWPEFSFVWNPEPFWEYYVEETTDVFPVFLTSVETGYDYSIYQLHPPRAGFPQGIWQVIKQLAGLEGGIHSIYDGWWDETSFYRAEFFLVRKGKPVGGLQLDLPEGLSLNLISSGSISLPSGGSIAVSGTGAQSVTLPDGSVVTIGISNGTVTASVTPPGGSVSSTTSTMPVGNTGITVSVDGQGAAVDFPSGMRVVLRTSGHGVVLLPGGTSITVSQSGKISVQLAKGTSPILAKAVDILGKVLSSDAGVIFSVKDLLGNVSSVPGASILDLGVTANGSLEVGVRLGDGPTIWIGVSHIDIEQVYERDQKWNRAPNPKSVLDYQNNLTPPIPDDELRNYLFVAVEPDSGKADLVVKTSLRDSGSIGSTVLCGVRRVTPTAVGPILSGAGNFAQVGSDGQANLSFTPDGSVHDITYRLIVGIDANSDGELTEYEVIKKDGPASQRFHIKVVNPTDYEDAYDYIDTRDHWFVFPVAQSFVRYFDANNTSVTGATLASPTVFSVAGAPQTQIAGSPYNQSDGTTTVTRFQLPEGSNASNKIEATFELPVGGMRSVIYNIWNVNKPTLAAPFISNPSLSESTLVRQIGPTVIAFYNTEDFDDLIWAFGGASIQGTVTFVSMRDPANSNRIILKSVLINGTVSDQYDFDWTRDPNSMSRKGATLQIGWEPATRNAGRIFSTDTTVTRTYANETMLEDFNTRHPLLLNDTNPGASMPSNP